MNRYFLELAYLGLNYHGWQKQPGAVTIQQTVEERMSLLLRRPVELTVAGRTDTGVHARQTFAHFDSPEPLDLSWLRHRLNAFLPPDIAVKNILPVRPHAHARYDAMRRTYRYVIVRDKDPFWHKRAWLVREPLDLARMEEAARILLQYEDFESFSKVKTDVKTFLCRIYEARWEVREGRLEFVITANRFLRNMVRAITGTLVDIGLGKYPPSHMHEIIRAKDRRAAGPSAPGYGLYLEKVEYPPEIFLPSPADRT
ncbi:MAG: tRNA pseudouridine(38-40) synthase TruA [Chlorobi bacterium]|nr:tRNA pseudouridine(38-40) synthase TruA [Chlorobiota bacterium]